MPSKKKKARGKARRATKSRKAKAEGGAVNDIDSQMQRMQISNNNDDEQEEDTLLEAAIDLAAAEREELEAAAKNDEANNSQLCNHGRVPLPRVCLAFVNSFADEHKACRGNPNIYDIFEHPYEATKTEYAEVWNDPTKIQWTASHFIEYGTHAVLEDDYFAASRSAMLANFFEQWAAIDYELRENETQTSCTWNIFQPLCDWGKIVELYEGDEHTLVSFFRKRITCKCLDDKYKEVKSITKIGLCYNPNCSLPNRQTIRSTMLSCTQCRRASYCSRECQAAHWPLHKQLCVIHANRLAAQKLRQKK